MIIRAIQPNDGANAYDGDFVSIWVQGCPHHCYACHNPETWSFKCDDMLDHFSINNKQEFLTFMSIVIKLADKDNINRSLSVLGGEPLCPENEKYVLDMITLFHKLRPDRKIILWTGYTMEELKKRYKYSDDIIKDNYWDILKNNVSYMITDRFILAKRDSSLPLRGSSNQRIWEPSKFGPFKYFKNVTKSFDNGSKYKNE